MREVNYISLLKFRAIDAALNILEKVIKTRVVVLSVKELYLDSVAESHTYKTNGGSKLILLLNFRSYILFRPKTIGLHIFDHQIIIVQYDF